jgi:hypothetical protein
MKVRDAKLFGKKANGEILALVILNIGTSKIHISSMKFQ